MNLKTVLVVIGCCIFPNVGGWLGAFITRSNMDWYNTLERPSWRPPNWLFGPMWTFLYTTMGYATYVVYRDGNGCKGRARFALILFGIQLAFNWIWTPIFFGLHEIGWALVDLFLVLGTASLCAASFFPINKLAGIIFLPYLVWGSFATALNFQIWLDNPQSSDSGEHFNNTTTSTVASDLE